MRSVQIKKDEIMKGPYARAFVLGVGGSQSGTTAASNCNRTCLHVRVKKCTICVSVRMFASIMPTQHCGGKHGRRLPKNEHGRYQIHITNLWETS